MMPYTTEQLRELSTAVGPQWQGEVRAALRYCADLIDAANAVIAQPEQAEHFGVEEPGESHHPGYYFTDRNK